MAGLNNTDHFTVQGWMVQELGLTGGLLTTYALVHQFSQSRAGVYTGGPQYLAAWAGCTVGTARIYLHKLVEMGLIYAKDEAIGGVLYRNYRVTEEPLRKSYPPTKIVVPPYENRSQKNKEEVSTNVDIHTVPPYPREKFDFRAALLQEGVEAQVADDWLKVRKAKRAENTKTSLDGLRREAKKAGVSIAEAVRYACEQSWAGFRADWYEERKARQAAQRPERKADDYMARQYRNAIELGLIPNPDADEQ